VTGRTLVIGVGNPSRRDDGVGWAVAEAAGRRLGGRVQVWQSDGEPARLLAAWADVAFAVVIDAMHSGAEPGTIRVFEPEEVPVPAPSVGSHAHGIAYAVALGRVLHLLPDRLVLVGIEAQEAGFGDGLSPRVAAAVDRTADLVARLFDAPRE
jgi:hydrogenase maturation protease